MDSRKVWAMRIRFIIASVSVVVISLLTSCVKNESAPSSVTAVEKSVPVGNLQVAMILLPGGTFQMGSASANAPADEQPAHAVSLTAFAMDKFEVTQDQFAELELPNPAHFKGERHPVEQIRWSEAVVFCNERSRAEGLEPCYDEGSFACNFAANGYRLPTEAEWEYAARAGSNSEYYFGTSVKQLSSHACYAGPSVQQTESVGSRRPNAWGFHDMLGNVAEWCQDVYSETYYSESDGATDPTGPVEGDKRVLRGGSWQSNEASCRVAARLADAPGISDACFTRDTYGFRCVRRLSADELAELEKR
ncbi:MAG: SUMF1/EgtB/PvdO family nonheme iron enzyme [Pirellulaceae bacterium]